MVRVGHEGRPDDATDSDSDDDKVPHVTLTVDSYYDEPNSIIKYGNILNIFPLRQYFLIKVGKIEVDSDCCCKLTHCDECYHYYLMLVP